MTTRVCLLSLLIYTMGLFAGLEEYFKPCPNKGSNSMKNIDFIYVINLDQRPEKYQNCIDQLNPYGIYPYRFSAVNGWELSLATIDKLGVTYKSWMESGNWGTCYLLKDEGAPHHEVVQQVGRNYFCHCMSRGAIGIVLSHLSVLQDAYDSGYETIWVMEDDIQIIKDPRLLSELITKLDGTVGKKGWDILFTDQDTKNQNGDYVPCASYAWRPNFRPANISRFALRKEVGESFRKVGARYGAYSMIVRRTGMKKILDFLKAYRIFLPYDMDFYMPNTIRLFAVTDDVVSTLPTALSDNGAPRYKDLLQ